MNTYETASEALNNVADEVLGKNWYIVDSVDGETGNYIMRKEIINKYKEVQQENMLLGKIVTISAIIAVAEFIMIVAKLLW